MITPPYLTVPQQKTGFPFMVEVYVDDFMSLVIPVSQEQLRHVVTAVMTGIHDVFPEDDVDSNDPISEKKTDQARGTVCNAKEATGF